jgi:hypothetical protein
VTLQREN